MNIHPLTLENNLDVLKKASYKKNRPNNQLVLWAKLINEWEMWEFSISHWRQYLEAHYVYGCMVMREGLENIILALIPIGEPIPDIPKQKHMTAAQMKAGLFSDRYVRDRGF